jgi:hypothetical protein
MPLLHCLLIYYTCDVNICVENGSWPTYVMHSVLPPEPGDTLLHHRTLRSMRQIFLPLQASQLAASNFYHIRFIVLWVLQVSIGVSCRILASLHHITMK